MTQRAFCLRSALLALLSLSPIASATPPINFRFEEFQPNVPNGGRVNTIAVHPANNDVILVGSESGGLFNSTDRGATWRHVGGLPAYAMASVVFVPADPNIVIATTVEDYRVANGGGIWRSTNRGLSWKQVASPPPPPGAGGRFGGSDISIAPDNGRIYVGTAYGVSMSDDRGATWRHVDVFGSGARVVFTVVALPGNRVIAGGIGGLRRSTDGGATWSAPADDVGTLWSMHALGASPFEPDQAYVVNLSRELWFTEDSGDHWTRIPSAPKGDDRCGGMSFIRTTGRVVTFPLRQPVVTLWFGNRCGLSTLDAPAIVGTSRFDYRGPWIDRLVDHPDTRDLAFDSARRPLLLGTDGGLHKTADNGMTWTLTGGGRSGYNALQITEVKGQWITDTARYHLYFATQDNDLWASSDGGLTWGNPQCCEGFFIERLYRVPSATNATINFVTCADCVNRVSSPLFAGARDWPDAQPKVGNVKTLGPSLHVQKVNEDGPFARGLAATTNLGTSWAQYATLPMDLREIGKSSQPGLLPVLYQPIKERDDNARGIEIDRLARIVKDPAGPGGIRTYPNMNNFGGLGINATMFAWYQVFAVDPFDADHLIAPDVVSQKMMETFDGADNWSENAALTSAVTGNGAFLFRDKIHPHASAISFSPDDPNSVAVGTMQGGVLVSGDRGKTWTKVPGSEAATYITSIEFRTAHEAIVSTYGRGLWRLRWQILRAPPDFARSCRLPCSIRPFAPFVDPVPWTGAVLAFHGRIQGARIVSGALRELFVRPGSSVAFFADANDFANVQITETMEVMGLRGAGRATMPADALLVGLVFADGKLAGAVVANSMLPMYEPSLKEQNPPLRVGSEEPPTAGKPYVHLNPSTSGDNAVEIGELIAVAGRGFPPGIAIEIVIDDRIAERIQTDENGEFAIRLPSPAEFGLHRVVVRDAEKKEALDGAMFLVRHRDARPGNVSSRP